MIKARFDLSLNTIIIEYSGKIDAAQAEQFYAEIQTLVPKGKKNFRILADLSEVQAMEAGIEKFVKKAMDYFDKQGVAEILRVIPDPSKDIGFNIMSLFHYSKEVKFLTLQSREEARKHLMYSAETQKKGRAMMKGFSGNIEKETVENKHFRKALYTGKHCQLVLMSLQPREEIGLETHPENDQFFRFEEGEGKCLIDGHEYKVGDGVAIIVPAGAKHNVINTSSSKELKMYTIYSPPHHKDGIVRRTKKEAEANEADFDGQTTE